MGIYRGMMGAAVRERKRNREEEGREGRRGRHAARARGRLNDDSEVDGFLGPFYIESQRSA